MFPGKKKNVSDCFFYATKHNSDIDTTTNTLHISVFHNDFIGSYYAPKIVYLSVIGNAIEGKERKDSNLELKPTSLEGFAFESYSKVCGDGNKIGDGVVPCCAGHLDGAMQITLKDV